MRLEVNLVVAGAAYPEDVVETHFHHGRRGQVGGDVPADPRAAVEGLQHHGDRVPADDVADARLEFHIARVLGLILDIDRVLVGGIQCRLGQHDPLAAQVLLKLDQQRLGFRLPPVDEHIVERFDPFLLLDAPAVVDLTA